MDFVSFLFQHQKHYITFHVVLQLMQMVLSKSVLTYGYRQRYFIQDGNLKKNLFLYVLDGFICLLVAYEEGNIEIIIYQCVIGDQYHKKVKVYNDDVDLDNIDDHDLLSNYDEDLADNNEIISTLDIPSFNDNLMKRTLPISQDLPQTKKSKKGLKRTKKQKPNPNSRESYCLFPRQISNDNILIESAQVLDDNIPITFK